MFLAKTLALMFVLMVSPAMAQSSPGFLDGKPLCANYPNANCPSPANPLSLNQAFELKSDYPYLGPWTALLGGPNSWTALNSFNGGAIVPTLSFGDNSTNAASTAFVQSAAGTSSNVLYATNFSGATSGDKISACVAALPSGNSGGVCDARGLPSGTIPAITLAKSGVTLLGPCGYFIVTGTIQIYNPSGISGFTWRGCGADFGNTGTTLSWEGNTSDPMIRIRGVRDSEFEDFGINSNIVFPLATAVRLETATGTTSTSRIFRHVLINGTNAASAGLTKGMQWCTGDNCGGAGGDANNDLDYIENVSVVNYFNTAYSIEGTQAKTIMFVNSQMATGARGVSTTQGAIQSGSFRWFGPGGGHNSVADFDLGSVTDNILIQGCNIEGSNRLLQTAGPSSAVFPVTILDCRWSADNLNADNNVVFYQDRGPLNFTSNIIESPAAGANPQINISTSGLARGVAIGNSIAWATGIAASNMPFVSSPGSYWTTSGNVVTNTSNTIQFPIYDLVAPNPLTFATLPACNSGTQGSRQFITDQATSVAYHGAVTGSGSTAQGVTCDGTAWYQD
jgi:hypothetical protein